MVFFSSLLHVGSLTSQKALRVRLDLKVKDEKQQKTQLVAAPKLLR